MSRCAPDAERQESAGTAREPTPCCVAKSVATPKMRTFRNGNKNYNRIKGHETRLLSYILYLLGKRRRGRGARSVLLSFPDELLFSTRSMRRGSGPR